MYDDQNHQVNLHFYFNELCMYFKCKQQILYLGTYKQFQYILKFNYNFEIKIELFPVRLCVPCCF